MISVFYSLLALTVLAAAANALTQTVSDYNPIQTVFDSDGVEVRANGSYYIVPRLIGLGGGLSLSPLAGKQCPLYIGQESSALNVGIPVKFSNTRRVPISFVAPENENINIEMDVKATSCDQSTYWWVYPTITNTDNPEIIDFFITAGPAPDNTEGSASSFFKIIKKSSVFLRNTYTIAFCPGGGCSRYIGIAKDKNGVRRLVLGSAASAFQFVLV